MSTPKADGILAVDVPNVLAFLSWQVPIQGATPNDEMRDQVECGRMAILDACRVALLARESAAS